MRSAASLLFFRINAGKRNQRLLFMCVVLLHTQITVIIIMFISICGCLIVSSSVRLCLILFTVICL